MNKNKTIKICLVAILAVICFSSNSVYASEFTGTVSSTSTSSASQTGGTVGGGGSSVGSTIGGTVTTNGAGSGGNAIAGTITTTNGNNSNDNANNTTDTNNIGNTDDAGDTGTGGPIPEFLSRTPSNYNRSVLGANTTDAQEPLAINSQPNTSNITNAKIILPFTASIAGAFENFGIEFWFWIILLLLLLAAVIYYIYEDKKEKNSINK